MLVIREPEDYPFCDKKFLQRQNQVRKCGERTASAFNKLCKMQGVEFTIVLKDKVAESIARIYRSKVRRFKYDHKFPIDANINQEKVAALFIESALDFCNDSNSTTCPLFSLPPQFEETSFSDGIIQEFLWEIVCSILLINQKKVQFEVRRDFAICVDRYDIKTEWLIWTFHMFCKSYGTPWNIED